MSQPLDARAAGHLATPTQLEVQIGGRPLAPSALAAITEVHVRTALGMPAQAQLTVRLDAVAGHREALFVGEVTVVEREFRPDAGRLLVVRGYDPLHRLRKRASVRRHADVDLAGLASTLAEGTGLTVDAPAEPLGDVYQCGVSDLELLVERAARVGRHPVVDEGRLRLVTLEPPPAEVELGYGRTLHSGHLQLSVEPGFDRAVATGWDPAAAAAGHGEAGRSAAAAGLTQRPNLAAAGGGGARVRADEPVVEPSGAGAAGLTGLAQAQLDVLTAATVVGSFACDGNPAIRAGRSVRVSGLAPELDGVFLVCAVVHRIDATGFVTEIDTRPPAGPAARHPDRLTLGEVTDVADPDGRGRVVVRLPAYEPLLTTWVPVLTAGAGADKGVVALPAPGDTVLVALLAGDPAHAIVLGGLYGSQRPPAPDDARPGTQVVLRTATGQQVSIDGTRHALTLTDGLSVLELGPDLLRITSATDVLVEAAGKAMRFRARSVDFEEAP